MEENKTMYRVEKYSAKVIPFKVVKVTDKRVKYIGRHGGEHFEGLNSNWQIWFDTMEEANIYIQKTLEDKVKGLEYQLEKAQEKLSEFYETLNTPKHSK